MTKTEFIGLAEAIRQTPALLEQSINGLSAEQLCRRLPESEFSILEHICHLRDIEREGYALRVRKILDEVEPFLPDIDGSRLAIERDYNHQRFEPAWQDFIEARNENARVIGEITPDQLQRCGNFEYVGVVTLERLLLMMREHDEDHLKTIEMLAQQLQAQSLS